MAIDVYEDLRVKALEELEKFNKSQIVEDSLNYTLPNWGDETDYDAWLTGSEQFADDHFDAMKKRLH